MCLHLAVHLGSAAWGRHKVYGTSCLAQAHRAALVGFVRMLLV